MSQELPEGTYLKDISAHYNHLTIPRELRAPGRLPPETWGRLVVEEGEIQLFVEPGAATLRVTPAAPGIIPADSTFRVEDAGVPARFYIEYHHEPRIRDAAELSRLLAKPATGGR